MNRQNFSHFPFAHLLLLQRWSSQELALADLACSLDHIHPFTLHPCRWTNHPHRVLKRLIETKVPPGTMAQTGTGKERRRELKHDIT
jgi:hypothetical protein